jgi:hypothetical protein
MDISIDEKRVYDASEGPTPVFVAGEFGVARVDTSDDLVGEFGLARQCAARDAAGRDGRLAVATDEDVLVGVFGDGADEADGAGKDGEASGDGDAGKDGEASGDDRATDEVAFEALGVGPSVAVGLSDDSGEMLVAREDGAVLRGGAAVRDGGGGNDGSAASPSWTELGDLDDVRAVDGDLLAAASGVYRATDDGLRHVGLDDARDVSAGSVPLAATGDGLYRLGNGWLDELPGEFRAVSATPASDPGTLGWAHAAGTRGLLAHVGGDERTGGSRASSSDESEGEWREADSEWHEADLPVTGEIVGVDHGEEGAYAVTAEGTFLLSVGDGWNHQRLGLRGVRAVAAP